MSTESQINANRQNAQKSTGPKTPEGKKKVSQNAVLNTLITQARSEITEARSVSDGIEAHTQARSVPVASTCPYRRGKRSEDGSDGISSDDSQIENRTSKIENEKSLLGQILLDDFRQTHCLEKIQKYEMAIERSFFRTLKELRQLQSLRLNVAEAPAESNVEPSRFGSSSVNSKNKPNCDKKLSDLSLPKGEAKSGEALAKTDKPKIPSFDPMQLLSQSLDLCGTVSSQSKNGVLAAENRTVSGITNPIGPDPLTKIMMKKDNFQRLTKKAM